MSTTRYAVIGEQLCWPCYYTWLEDDNVPATFESEAEARAEIQDYLEEWILTRTDEQSEDGDTPEDFQVFKVEIDGKDCTASIPSMANTASPSTGQPSSSRSYVGI